MLTEKEMNFLLECARTAIRTHDSSFQPPAGEISPALREKKSVFVSLHIDGQLRGCIGNLAPVVPLFRAVIENAVSAAYRDPRFPPLQGDEADTLEIEVSVLSEPGRFHFKNPEELLEKLDSSAGVVLKKGLHHSTFLPQVWEQVREKRQFMEQLAIKAGLPPDGWRDAEVYLYSVEKFCGLMNG